MSTATEKNGNGTAGGDEKGGVEERLEALINKITGGEEDPKLADFEGRFGDEGFAALEQFRKLLVGVAMGAVRVAMGRDEGGRVEAVLGVLEGEDEEKETGEFVSFAKLTFREEHKVKFTRESKQVVINPVAAGELALRKDLADRRRIMKGVVGFASALRALAGDPVDRGEGGDGPTLH